MTKNIGNFYILRYIFLCMKRESGFPSPAQGYEAKSINLNEELIKNPDSTYLMRAKTNKMSSRGVFADSILVVDRSIIPNKGDLVVASIDGAFVCLIYFCKNGKQELLDEEYQVYPTEENQIFGTVISIITQLH